MKKATRHLPFAIRLKAGQALVTLLVFISIATTIIGAAVVVTIINSQSTSKYEIGQEALSVAEAGADNAILRILRDPSLNYSSETLTVGNGTAEITITYSLPTITITSKGTVSSLIRKIEIIGNYSSHQFTTTSYKQTD